MNHLPELLGLIALVGLAASLYTAIRTRSEYLSFGSVLIFLMCLLTLMAAQDMMQKREATACASPERAEPEIVSEPMIAINTLRDHDNGSFTLTTH